MQTLAPSKSAAINESVTPALTTTSLNASVNPAALGQSVTFMAVVTPTLSGSSLPTGVVTFMDGMTSLGTGTITINPATGVSQATLSTSSLTSGSHSITAVYSGDSNFASSGSGVIHELINTIVSAVHLFYDNSKFNKNIEGVAPSDDKAIDTTKTAYLAGTGTATFANTSSFTDGINGVMIDLSHGGANGHLNVSDFTLRVGLNNSPSKWATSPVPSTISVRAGSGTGGSDRVELTWTDGSITQEWLEVTVNADANTGLATPYTFFYGSVMANSGTGDTGALLITSSTDENAARNHAGTAVVTNVFDYNKDGFVNSSDENAARNNGATIKFIKIAANTPLAPDGAAAVAPDLAVAPVTTVTPASTGDTGMASGLTALLNCLKTGTLPPLRLDWLSSELTNVNLNSGAAATIFEALATADTKLTRSILVEADKVADESGLDDELLESILVDLRLE